MAQIVVLKRAHFFSIDNDLIDVHAKTIGAIGVAIYAVLARYANRKTGDCWPAIASIAQTLQLARSTVKLYLRRLEQAGLIAIRERQDTAGDATSNLYTLLDPSPAVVDKRLQPGKRLLRPCPKGVGRLPTHPRPPVNPPVGRLLTPNHLLLNKKKRTTPSALARRKAPRLHPATPVHIPSKS